MSLAAVSLDDKYELESGSVFLTGLQALVRLPMMQRQRDLAAGLNTAGFISGYRGSPLGGYDLALWQAGRFLRQHHVHFQPGVNEDLGATAVWGSQQVNIWAGAKYDGVFGIWYGKGPGVDRSMDPLKHGNSAGASRHGGVLVMAGDDHGANSSTMPHQSEQVLMSALIPVFNPAGVQEYIDLGLYGFALSRFSGCWVGFKCVGDTIESSASVAIDPRRIEIVTPDFEMPPGGLNIRYPDPPREQEERLIQFKLPAAQAFARANRLDRIVMDSPRPRLGIVTTGKAYLDVRQALDELGIDDAAAAALGLRLYKVTMTWPLEPAGALEFARGLEQIIVVEEKRPVIEEQLMRLLYNRADMPRVVVGKFDEEQRPLLPDHGELNPGMIARALVGRLKRFEDRPEFAQRLSRLEQIEAQAQGAPPSILRTPYFCSGCPHNTSTKIPEGSRAMAGIGCHGMALWVPDRNTQTITHMGGEGVNWIGQAPFTNTSHVFQNLGDGTYFHSGLLAIRAAIAANVNITYKVLYNDATAMTGGQPADGEVTPWRISQQVKAEGAKKVVLVSDEPDKYPIGIDWAPGTEFYHRDELDKVQRDLREIPGVTVLIYDQTCAAEKRRRRKRGLFPDPPRRAFINDLVCEGCGDCSVQSNCVSVQPLDTGFGRKRRIDQSNCNKDFSCIKGFCPSFVTVHGGEVRKAKPDRAGAEADDALFDALPAPNLPPTSEPFGILVTGIGGTGVITIGALLGMAAHIEGKGVSVLDITGLAQKNGAVGSHVRIADAREDLHSVRIANGGAKLLLGCDIVVAGAPDSLARVNQGTTFAVINSHVVPTAQFVQDNTLDLANTGLERRIKRAAGDDHAFFVNATEYATALMGDSIATNMFMLGAAYQIGQMPLSEAAIFRAIELNGVAIEANKRAFRWGRLAVHDPAAVEARARPLIRGADVEAVEESLDDLIAGRVRELTAYQDAAYAARYRAAVDKVAAAEADSAKGRTGLVEAVARHLYKLMAYKDEYEVARLYTSGDFMERLRQQFDGDVKLSFHLAPPLIARRDPQSGHLQKREFGPWVWHAFKWLARLKGLRGTAWDIFGRTAERRMERALIGEYEAMIDEVLSRLDQDSHALACQIAELPDKIRGFGHIKETSVHAFRAERELMLQRLREPAMAATAAE